MFKYGIKLPRKRKKAFIKDNSDIDYLAQGIICEILWEEKPVRKNRSFYKYRTVGWKVYVVKRY